MAITRIALDPLTDEAMWQAVNTVIRSIAVPAPLAASEIRATLPQIAVLVLSQHMQRRYAVELLGDRPTGVG